MLLCIRSISDRNLEKETPQGHNWEGRERRKKERKKKKNGLIKGKAIFFWLLLMICWWVWFSVFVFFFSFLFFSFQISFSLFLFSISQEFWFLNLKSAFSLFPLLGVFPWEIPFAPRSFLSTRTVTRAACPTALWCNQFGHSFWQWTIWILIRTMNDPDQ